MWSDSVPEGSVVDHAGIRLALLQVWTLGPVPMLNRAYRPAKSVNRLSLSVLDSWKQTRLDQFAESAIRPGKARNWHCGELWLFFGTKLLDLWPFGETFGLPVV